MNSLIEDIFDTSNAIKDGRTIKDVYIYSQSEMGELAEEINIDFGHSNKLPGKDGIVGEAIDAIICLFDLIHIQEPELTPQAIQLMCQVKLLKWHNKK